MARSDFSHIIAENILDELQCVIRHYLIKHHLLFLAGRTLELLLNKSRAMLVAAKFNNETKYVLAL